MTPALSYRSFLDRFHTGAAWTLLASVASQGSTLAINVSLARLLKVDAFGQFAMANSTLITVSTVATFGLGAASARLVSEQWARDRNEAQPLIAAILALVSIAALAAAFLLAIFAPWVADEVLADDRASQLLRIVSPALLFAPVVSCQQSALMAIGEFRSVAIASLALGVGAVGLTVGAAWTGGAPAALAALGAISALRWGVFHFLLRRTGMRPWRNALGGIRDLAASPSWRSYLLPAALSGFVTMPVLWMAQALVYRMDGSDAIAAYAIAMQFRTVAIFLPTILNTTASSVLNRILGGDSRHYRKLYRHNLLLSVAASGTMALAIFAVSDPLLGFFGETVAGNWKRLLAFLLISAVIESAAVAAYQAVQSGRQMWRALFLVTIPRDALFLVLTIALAPTIGAEALGVAYAASWLVCLGAIWAMARIQLRRLEAESA